VHGFDLIRGQRQAIGLLSTLLRKGHIPHALVFTGIDGIGKQMAAKAFAMACNCTDPQPFQASQAGSSPAARTNACGQCRTCRRILADNHPDILHLHPSGNMIRIAVIRDLIQRLSIKPYEQGKRIVIIAGSHAMNPEASNALLKILEEPPENTLLILTTRQTTDLLPTIISRCQQIRFSPLTRDVLVDLLTMNDTLTPEEASAATALSGGSYTQALKMVREGWIPRRNWLANEISGLNDQSTTSQLALAEKLAAGKTQLPDTLAWLVSWYRDLIVFPFQPEQIVNHDLLHQIRAAAADADPLVLIGRMKAVQKALKQLQANANLRLTMDDLVLQLAAA
jgi:DNA polymerase III subunit delta'